MELMNRRIVYSKQDPDYCTQADAFCSCNDYRNGPVVCDCGEDIEVHEWAWDEQLATATTLLSNDNREVRFHPGYSSGTAAIRGDSPFQQGHIYYWEIKMLTSLYGTDVMVGVGTKKAQLDKSTYQFCSLLGSDKESWGFSYKGKLQHNGKSEWYGPPYGKGSIIGIYLDMWKGTLEFFLNRRPLGVAFTSLQGQKLYPMVCSTAAQSAMRVTYAVSHPVDLKLLSLQALRNDAHILAQLALVPGLRRFITSTWWIGSGHRPHDYYDEVRLIKPTRKRPPECCDAAADPSGLIPCVHQQYAADDNASRRFRRLCLICDIIL
uniref:B30.2/SPRY domain-containing protein n=1 Tax=Cuerna arida TaxID=1464854 RepID=A0A1B6EHL9_9HEMI